MRSSLKWVDPYFYLKSFAMNLIKIFWVRDEMQIVIINKSESTLFGGQLGFASDFDFTANMTNNTTAQPIEWPNVG